MVVGAGIVPGTVCVTTRVLFKRSLSPHLHVARDRLLGRNRSYLRQALTLHVVKVDAWPGELSVAACVYANVPY